MDLGDFDCKPALTRAFQRCKSLSKVTRNNNKCPILDLFGFQNGGKHGDDYLEFSEFRIFLATLRQYFEYFETLRTASTLLTNHRSDPPNLKKKDIESFVASLADRFPDLPKLKRSFAPIERGIIAKLIFQ